ncbi:hypothetical protein SLEP1_g7542 [Rubroshorea leprosula]|uniref:Secreted protein n=1 Tax=Rubroshorea leprosula TaxID=152421 RepID=A0AAV5I9P9_9ROSI|nr:hypothetical protein SLEP1_g7542 [Rubroshorea leprosula]
MDLALCNCTLSSFLFLCFISHSFSFSSYRWPPSGLAIWARDVLCGRSSVLVKRGWVPSVL